MSTRRTVAVLGPIPHDRITTHHGDILDRYCCVLYTVAALSALMATSDRICPVVHVRREDEEPIKKLLKGLPNVDLTGIRSATDSGDIVELDYVDQNVRIERQTGFMSPILPKDVRFVLDADAFVCVPITDYEVSNQTLAYIRQNSNGTILLDGHGPTNALSLGGERVRRLWVDRDAWLGNVDMLKMNLEEAGCSWFAAGSGPSESVFGAPLPVAEMPRFAEHCLRRGVQAVCITLDEKGCVLYQLDRDGALQEEFVPPVPVSNVIDTTGCGDSYAAGMAFGYLEHHDFVSAARYGNALGAQRCSEPGLAYHDLAETNRQILDTYGSLSLA
jgi:hypothetical protein